ncbi:hypothetical protein [Mycobacterium sp. IS-1556]|uniref:hypothetical protein n=1 Tax=Mycobacterium sp. IS-1556 TaxID=1772276 RepID=UPI000A5B56C4|nr:hypothetical protein [Mycobacterium sp. IS-1556]
MTAKLLNSIKGFLFNSIKTIVLFLHGSGPAAIGRLEYRLRPARTSWGGPMNGQAGRVKLCRQIFAELPPAAIVETGTFLGTTTEFFAEFGVPVYTAEVKPRYHAYSDLRFRPVSDRVHVVLADSRVFLRQLAADPSFPKEKIFFYLDSHWYSDLPLLEEIDVIFGTWKRSIIMIDDFAVPGEPYAHTDDGQGADLNGEYLDALGRTDMFRFYPSLPASQETGYKTGCIILCNDPETQSHLSKLETLRPG